MLVAVSVPNQASPSLGGAAVANALAFSPDGSILCFADTAEGTIRRYSVPANCYSLVEHALLAPSNLRRTAA